MLGLGTCREVDFPSYAIAMHIVARWHHKRSHLLTAGKDNEGSEWGIGVKRKRSKTCSFLHWTLFRLVQWTTAALLQWYHIGSAFGTAIAPHFYPRIFCNHILLFTKDYFGEAVCGTNACRMMVFTMAQLMDQVTDNNDWNVYKDWNAPLRWEKMLFKPWDSWHFWAILVSIVGSLFMLRWRG